MTNPTPQGTKIRKAVAWISEKIVNDDLTEIKTYIREAINKFDLSPLEADGLYRFYKDCGEQKEKKV